MHLPYACRHSGACCSSGWPIPIEHARVTAVATLRADMTWLAPMSESPDEIAGALALAPNRHCVFHRHGCEIQHVLGHGAMPASCQHFPRVVLLDPRGIFVTLSHYCPTAVDLLFTHQGPVRIVAGPKAVPDTEPEGLDARDVLPPLLVPSDDGRRRRNGILMDLEAYAAWEARLVAVLTAGAGPAEAALRQLRQELVILQRWRPGGQTLAAAVADLEARPAEGGTPAGSAEEVAEQVVRRYLAARGFASWAAYQGGGPVGVLDGLDEALRLVRATAPRMGLREAIRQADFRLIHHGNG